MRSLAPLLGWLALAATPAAAQTVISGVGLEGSEAARHDPVSDHYVVTNLGPRGAGNDGFISLLAPDGTVKNLKWISGGVGGVELRDPLGVIIAGDTIYVADTTAVRKFDRRTGAPTGSIDVPGAVRLNDLAMGGGVLYVTDSGSDDSPGALFAISADGVVTAFAQRDPALERPNGIAVTPDGAIVHGGRGVNLVFRNAQGSILREVTLPTGRMDGIVALADGGLLVASQDGHNVYHLPPDGGKPTVVAKDIEVPAAIGHDAARKRLIVPQIRAASVTLFDLP